MASYQDILDAINALSAKFDAKFSASAVASLVAPSASGAWESLHAFRNYDGSPLLSDPTTRAAVVNYITEQHVWPEPVAPYGADVAGWADPRTFAASFICRLRYLPGELTGFAIVAASQVDLDYLKSLTFDKWTETFWRSWGGGPSGGDAQPSPSSDPSPSGSKVG